MKLTIAFLSLISSVGALPYTATSNLIAVGLPKGDFTSTSGTATHLGAILDFGTYTVSDNKVTGEGTQIAANGDELHYEFDEEVDFSMGSGVADFTFTGGTGRFEGATGSGKFYSKVTPIDDDPPTLNIEVQYVGEIFY